MSETVDLTGFPQALANQLGISLFAGQMLASLIFLVLVMLPVLFFTRGKNIFATLIVGMSSLGFCVALGWFPAWSLVMIVFITVLLFSTRILGIFQ